MDIKSYAVKIMGVLNDIDPEGFVSMGAPEDEYRQEALILLHRVLDRPLTPEYVRDVWLVKFASGESLGPNTHGMAGRHNQRLREWVGDMPMRPEFARIAKRVNAMFPGSSP